MELMAHWQKFRAIPDETKKLFRYIKDVGRGYENKIQEEVIDGGTISDKKENFHLVPMDYSRLMSLAQHQVSNEEHLRIILDFICSAQLLHLSIIDFMESIRPGLQELVLDDFESTKINLKEEFEESWYQWIIRTLFYHPGQDISVDIAGMHLDKGFITLNWRATAPGLQVMNVITGEMSHVDIPEGYVLIQAGLQFDYLTGIKALPHRVINSKIVIKIARCCLVAFCDINGLPQYDKAKFGRTHTIKFLDYIKWSRSELLKRF
ncbi:MAG: isopenicillin N synthase-like dioxygenase [Candidatus Paceibacteria bacterium]